MNKEAVNPTTPGEKVLRRFSSYSFMGGVAGGLLVGVLLSGPHFDAWAISTSLLVIVGSTFVGGLIGFTAVSSAAAGLAHGGGVGTHDGGLDFGHGGRAGGDFSDGWAGGAGDGGSSD